MSLIGTGGAANVYLSGKTATKVFKNLRGQPTSPIHDYILRELNTAQIVGSSTPGLVRYKSHILSDSSASIKYEYAGTAINNDVLGLTSRTTTKSIRSFSVERLWSMTGMCYSLFRALANLHKLGICHRDINLNNILRHNDEYVICDFSLAKHRTSRMTLNCGVVTYAAPEILAGRSDYSMSADVWSMAMVIYNYFYEIPMIRGQDPNKALDSILACVPSSAECRKYLGVNSSSVSVASSPAVEFHRFQWPLAMNAAPELTAKLTEFMTFLKYIFVVDPRDRPTAEDITKHPFLAKYQKPTISSISTVDDDFDSYPVEPSRKGSRANVAVGNSGKVNVHHTTINSVWRRPTNDTATHLPLDRQKIREMIYLKTAKLEPELTIPAVDAFDRYLIISRIGTVSEMLSAWRIILTLCRRYHGIGDTQFDNEMSKDVEKAQRLEIIVLNTLECKIYPQYLQGHAARDVKDFASWTKCQGKTTMEII